MRPKNQLTHQQRASALFFAVVFLPWFALLWLLPGWWKLASLLWFVHVFVGVAYCVEHRLPLLESVVWRVIVGWPLRFTRYQ